MFWVGVKLVLVWSLGERVKTSSEKDSKHIYAQEQTIIITFERVNKIKSAKNENNKTLNNIYGANTARASQF